MQTTVEVHVLQGERSRASQNKSLGKFHLAGIPPAPRGLPQIEVTFDLDSNGILNVAAKDKATNVEQKITITGSGALSDDEVSNMVTESEAHKAEDEKFRELAEARNQGDGVAYQLEKTLTDLGEKVPGQEADEIPREDRGDPRGGQGRRRGGDPRGDRPGPTRPLRRSASGCTSRRVRRRAARRPVPRPVRRRALRPTVT